MTPASLLGVFTINYSEAQYMIESAKRILITCHARPDGDAVGSIMALKAAIEQLALKELKQCSVQALFLSVVPDVYQFLLDEEPWILGDQLTEDQVTDGALDDFDLIIVADTRAVRQLPGVGEYLVERTKTDKSVLVLDHHISGSEIGQCQLIDTKACATGEIVYDLCRASEWHISKESAEAIFVAICTDTGWFKFSNTSVDAFVIAGELVAIGVKVDELYQQLFMSHPPAKVHLVSETLDTLELLCDERLAVMRITQEMLKQVGADHTHIENIVNEPMQIGSVIAAVLMVEQKNGFTRCSLRSKERVDVNAVANKLGGGGHARAAGLTLEMPMDQAREKIVAAMSDAIDG